MPYAGRYSQPRKPRGGESERRTELGRFLDNHVRLIAALATVLILLGGFFAFELFLHGDKLFPSKNEGEPMSVAFLVALDDKTSP